MSKDAKCVQRKNTKKGNRIYLDDSQIKALQCVIHDYLYVHRNAMASAYKVLKSAESPYAPAMYDALTASLLSLTQLELVLKQRGFDCENIG